jgi:hypothetical protein
LAIPNGTYTRVPTGASTVTVVGQDKDSTIFNKKVVFGSDLP